MGSIETKSLKCNENKLPPKPIKFMRDSNISLYHQLFALCTHPPHTVMSIWETLPHTGQKLAKLACH